MAFQPMTIEVNHRLASCGQSHRFGAVIFWVCPDAEEVGRSASFTARYHPRPAHSIPLFCANSIVLDLTAYSGQQAEDPIETVIQAGLENVYVDNRHLLGLVH
jgi:hypothetical protein